MNDMMVPDWIKAREAEDSLREAQRQAEGQRQIADSLRIQKDGKSYFQTVLKELARNTDALERIKFRGNTEPLPSLSGETNCRVSVSVPGVFPKQTYTDVYFDGDQIRCSMLNGGVRNYYLCVDGGTLGVLPEIPTGATVPLSPEDLAEAIVRKMVEYLSRPII